MKRLTAFIIIGTAFLMLTPVANAAMGAKFDSPLHLTQSGGVVATGPISHWDADAVSAVIVAKISQNGQTVTGTSKRIQAGTTRWSAYATGGTLHPGSAVAHGTALVTLKGGKVETYRWQTNVTLTQ